MNNPTRTGLNDSVASISARLGTAISIAIPGKRSAKPMCPVQTLLASAAHKPCCRSSSDRNPTRNYHRRLTASGLVSGVTTAARLANGKLMVSSVPRPG